MREHEDLPVDDLLGHPLLAEALRDGSSSATLEGVLRELHRLGEWVLGGHDDWAADDVAPVWDVVCSVRPRGEPDTVILASGPHALAAAARCLLKTLRHVQRSAEAGVAELQAMLDD